jgi:class 3 adenylate cyclase
MIFYAAFGIGVTIAFFGSTLAVGTAIIMERKLAAILAADVVGYSALMEADETGTHERLKAGRKELFEPEIARHHGLSLSKTRFARSGDANHRSWARQ